MTIRASGTLHGRSGSLVFQHSGKMMIIIAGGKHSYEFDYTLAETG